MGKNKNTKKNKVKNKKIETLINKIKMNKGKIYFRTIEILGIVLSILALVVSLMVRQDTTELTKLSEKPMYYKIKIYPTNETGEYREEENYINWNLQLLVDDFEIYKENFIKVNYNSIFSHITYYMVYDYDIQNKKYFYKFDALDDKTQAKMRLEDEYYICTSNMNYSLTPNKQYCYILIHTETLSEQNLDLVFFKYNKDKENKLEFIKVDDSIQVDITDVREEHLICRDYYSSTWSESEEEYEDINFMFDVYEDLREKIKEEL